MSLWVFGYGSLLWNPGFVPAQTVKACLHDYHRSFCMLSIHHRGSEEEPGLVLALDAAPGGRCTGVAFQVKPDEEDKVLGELRARELVSSAYFEQHVDLRTDNGETIRALAYVIDPDHEQYCQFALEKQAQMIATAVGGRGPNTEYLYNTAAHLDQMNIRDTEMAWLVARVRALTAT
ncbi:gamma-glutamylcyclotransferase [Loktanella sp. D2R18]|uniref:gamma-glutamylcyclotransferase n=1 Tax=Rhodobacterales TaxID=204455 RepID=UPI000DE948AB|nr:MULTISPECIES: gamma-glutamylcyclotransferase [Rhodobacterales]MDO6591411.1 gamma-glutamylcyclotransferase [Yoonia sp. 1_MG-2023]RBW43521.1 gamma-glutamylcyclotransferase [Loktanella sp. D2R18]